LCVRLRAAGWQIWCLDAEMTLHDAAMTRFGQFWKRAQRAGHAYAEGAAMHGAPPERHGVAGRNRALIWGAGLPVALLLSALIWPWPSCWVSDLSRAGGRIALPCPAAGRGGREWPGSGPVPDAREISPGSGGPRLLDRLRAAWG
jgi:hypothetical protein